MKYAVIAWFQFLVGLVLLGASDYYIRRRDGWLGGSGLPTPDIIWFGIPLVLGAVAIGLLWRSTINLHSPWARIAVVSVQACLGFVIYMAMCLWYVIETGIDSL